MPVKASDVTVTDLFCGAGGSSIGAARVGARLRMAMNHWKLAIETHNTNFPEADHDCVDISAANPRRYPSTNILIASPECTNHSLAKGRRRKGLAQRDLFIPPPEDPTEERSRATMWDVPRFAEFHNYDLVIVENVVDVRFWVCWEAWLKAMDNLGYAHRTVYLNSMFCHPTPQSRDRLYVVFWKKGNRAPDLEFRPPAWCPRCERNVEAVQSWKPGRTAGRYKRQYVYCCPNCTIEVTPYYYAALNAIDWTIPAERIGDRARPLKERTLARIRYGLEKYGRVPLQIITNMTTDGGPVRDLLEPGCTQTGSALAALVAPWLVPAGSNPGQPTGGADPIPTLTCSERLGVTFPPAFLLTYRNYEGGPGYPVAPLNEPLRTIVTNAQERLVIHPAALISLRDWRKTDHLVRTLADALPTQVAAGQQDAIVSPAPFLTCYYSQAQAASMAEAIPTITTRDHHALVHPVEELDVEDCYFRMLEPHEIGAGMAFPPNYVVLGNKRDKVKQYGNAVTPPAMEWLVGRGVESLEAA